MDKIYIYEDEGYKNLLPLVYLRPVFDLYCGMFTFRERIQMLYPQTKIYSYSRFNSRTIEFSNSLTLFINGRAILHSKLPDEDGVFVAGDEVAGVKIKNQKLKIKNLGVPISNKFLDLIKAELKSVEVEATVVKYPWDLIRLNEETIIKDGEKFKIKSAKLKVNCVFLDVADGPIYIGDNVCLKPPTIIEGPCYIGEGSLIDGAKIRKGTTIGRYCKIGGEVEESFFSDFSNKHHDGFVGHSYIGEWVNLGAGTITSDLKNTYGTVKVHTSFNNLVDTGLLKIGAFVGDHTKTGIGTLLDTGSVLGCFVNIYGGGVAPKYIPSFTWGTNTEYKLDKAIEVAKIVMARRRVELTKEYEDRIRKAFELTKDERNKQ